MNTIDLNSVNHLLLRKQHLAAGSQLDDICQIVTDIAGLHATGTKEPYLALFARTRNFNKEQLDNELYVKRTLGKIRCMRGTLYILTKAIIPIAHAATSAMMEKLSVRYMEFRGIPLSDYSAISRSILNVLTGKRVSIAEIKAKLKTNANLSAVVNLMCDQGLLVRVQSGKNWKARSYTYTPFHEHFPDINLNTFNEWEGIALLVQQYLTSFGPATEDDIAWWTGLGKTKVRTALETMPDHLASLRIQNVKGDFLILRSNLALIKKRKDDSEPSVNLLPNLDPYLMGYKQRQRYLRDEDYDYVFDRSGNATSTILLNGSVIGVWDFEEKSEPVMKIHLFQEVTDEVPEKLCFKAQQLGQFIADKEVRVKKMPTMVPLTQRTAGAFMSPLRDTQP